MSVLRHNLLVEIQLEIEAKLGVVNVGERQHSCTEARKTCNHWNIKNEKKRLNMFEVPDKIYKHLES